MADREIAQRQSAAVKQPLAARSVVWAQSGAADDGKEALPWSQQSAAAVPATKTKALRKQAGMPWYIQWLQP